MSKAQLILIPFPAIGHLVSTTEFANTLAQHDPCLLVTLLLIQSPFSPIDSFIKSLTRSHPNISLFHVPEAESPPLRLLHRSIEAYAHAYTDAHKPLVQNIVRDITLSSCENVPVVGLVLDPFCVSYLDIGNEFGIPSFIFSPSGMGFLNLMFHLPSRHEQVGREFGDSDSLESISGFSSQFPPRVFPEAVFNKDGGYDSLIKLSKRFKDVKGVVVNTFSELETSCKSSTYPKVYPVGPILNFKGHPTSEMDKSEWDKTMEWLDDQLESSVVFLCFGSDAQFEAEQYGMVFLRHLLAYSDREEQAIRQGDSEIAEAWYQAAEYWKQAIDKSAKKR